MSIKTTQKVHKDDASTRAAKDGREGVPAGAFPVGSTSLLVWVFFMTFIGRTILSPLLLPIERDLEISHAEGGSFFLVISLGLMLTMLFSGFISQRLEHHSTIAVAGWITGLSLLLLGLVDSLFWFRVGLFFLGAGAGLYLPSGVTTLTDVVSEKQWGMAIAVHELGPILGLASAPVFAEAALRYTDWRSLLIVMSVFSLAAGSLFFRFARGGRFHGSAPKWDQVSEILCKRNFVIISFFFIMAIGLEMGVYSMLPSYLVAGRGIDSSTVNTIVGTSRLTSLIMVFIAGWLSDRFGYQWVIGGVALAAGAVTALIGFGGGWALIAAVYLQPMLVSAFFPAGFTAMAAVNRPEQRNLAVSLVIPIAYLFGGGIFPTMIGRLAEQDLFGLGFVIIGVLTALGLFIVPALGRAGPSTEQPLGQEQSARAGTSSRAR
ncbi:MAG: MFS transporter [Spirochaetaceae bacterium]